MVHLVKRISAGEFAKSPCDQVSEPLIVEGLVSDWPAVKLWTPAYFMTHFGDRTVSVSHYQTRPEQRPKEKFKVELRRYFEATVGLRPDDENLGPDSYVAGWHFLNNAPELMDDIKIPAPFVDNLLQRVNKEVIKYDWISLFIGHSKAETPLHTDSFAVCVWLANVVGRKIIRIIPPLNYDLIKNGMDAFDEKNVDLWSHYGIPVFEGVINAGDVFLIPPGYWHQVKNQGFTVAISTNYLARNHFLSFEQQLKAKVLAPYLKLLKLKHEVLGSEFNHCLDTLRNFSFVENEEKFLTHLGKQLQRETEYLNRARFLMGKK